MYIEVYMTILQLFSQPRPEQSRPVAQHLVTLLPFVPKTQH